MTDYDEMEVGPDADDLPQEIETAPVYTGRYQGEGESALRYAESCDGFSCED